MGWLARTLVLAVSLLSFAQSGATAANPIPDKDEPAFRQALAAWLADDEATALPALGELADHGSRAAQILIALIDKSPDLQGPWLAALPRNERIALMRAPGGISGQSFMREAAESVPLAALWVALWDMTAGTRVVTDFAAMGEHRAAREAVVTLVARERHSFSSLADNPDYPPALRFYIWREWLAQSQNLDQMAQEILALHPGDPQRLLSGEVVAPEKLTEWLMSAPEALPVRTMCEARCADTVPSCVLTLTDALGGPVRVMTLGSPVETLIPAEAFAQSPRGQGALMRRALLGATARMRPGLLARTAEGNSCLGEIMATEATRY